MGQRLALHRRRGAGHQGLDHGWFEGAAAQAKRDLPEHGIYAVSFRKTKVMFPLVWAPDSKDVYAVRGHRPLCKRCETN